MRLPRFSPLDDRMLRRWRIQTLVIALVWAIFAGVRIGSLRQTATDIVITVVVSVIAIVFLVLFVLTFIEIRRRAADNAR